MKAMDTAATGMDAQVIRIDTIANNLANADTSGFKKSQVDFADLMYETIHRAGGQRTQSTQMPTGLQIGSGVRPVSTLKVFTQGVINSTGGQLDLAINGAGFFQVEHPNGEARYTRDGNFRIDSEGNIVNSHGFPLLPAIRVPTDATSISVGTDGTVSVTTPGEGATMTEIGNIELSNFVNPAGLSAEGGNLFAETDASGPPESGTPGLDGLGEIQEGYLEMSNVDVVSELVDLISAQRTYELNSKVVKAGDRILQATNYIAG